uniref:Transmembrane protein n=1 Tax=viral metagenome TaxID=1070528 RepID=A0A6M3KXL5_9ZZZZ
MRVWKWSDVYIVVMVFMYVHIGFWFMAVGAIVIVIPVVCPCPTALANYTVLRASLTIGSATAIGTYVVEFEGSATRLTRTGIGVQTVRTPVLDNIYPSLSISGVDYLS